MVKWLFRILLSILLIGNIGLLKFILDANKIGPASASNASLTTGEIGLTVSILVIGSLLGVVWFGLHARFGDVNTRFDDINTRFTELSQTITDGFEEAKKDRGRIEKGSKKRDTEEETRRIKAIDDLRNELN